MGQSGSLIQTVAHLGDQMKELLYQEIPTPEQAAVVEWLHQVEVDSAVGTKELTPVGFRLNHSDLEVATGCLVVFTWSLQRTTYLKVMQWSEQPLPFQQRWIQSFSAALKQQFPLRYAALPDIDLSRDSIFTALAPYYPLTVHYFQKIPKGEFDLTRVYWWEKRWREEVQQGRQFPKIPPLVQGSPDLSFGSQDSLWDVAIVGGALGALYAATMAQLGYRVALIERLPFGRMNREWNISRREIATLVEMGLFTADEIESLILREYTDGFNKFFDGYSPIKAPVLHTPTVLNLAIDADRLLALCGQKLVAAGGHIFERTEFQQAFIDSHQVSLKLLDLEQSDPVYLRSRVLVDAMGTASPIAQQLNHNKAFDSVCPTVGAVIKSGFEPGVWDAQFGDILASHGDQSRGRQLIWELFPGPGQELTFYLFHYHEVHPDNPGSLLEMYEDFFAILPEYRRCHVEALEWRKATFGYIPGRYGATQDRTRKYHRVLTIGDAAAMQSPLSFTGFGSLVRNLPRVADLLDTALKHDLLKATDLQRVRAYQSNSAVTWLFSRGMMVPTGAQLPPAHVNSILNCFFGVLAAEPPEVADNFIKDRAGWWDFTRMALKSARRNPQLLAWIWRVVGFKGFIQWTPTYVAYTTSALIAYCCRGWVPSGLRAAQSWLEPRFPRLWHRLLTWSYNLTYGHGQPRLEFKLATMTYLDQPEDQTLKETFESVAEH